jgi:outer membrane protein assembly factor BamD
MEPVELFRWSVEAFEEGEYGSAAEGLREFLLEEPLHPKVDSAQYLLGESRFRDGKYVQAAEAFDRLAVNRPGSRLADDAQLGVCHSYWRLSPDLPLDQSYTRDARDACQRLLQYYTPSPLEERARALRDSARHKLAAKQYRVARWYFDHGAFQSANIYLEEVLNQHPEAPVIPEVMATLFRSYRELGFDREARAIRERLLQEHGDSPAAREVRDLELPSAPS